MNSILTTVKKMVGIEENYTHYDTDLINYINSVFMSLNQIGVGPKDTYFILSKEETWDLFIGNDIRMEAVKTYMFLKVKLLFDPPSNSFATEAIERQITQMEWRLNLYAEAVSQ